MEDHNGNLIVLGEGVAVDGDPQKQKQPIPSSPLPKQLVATGNETIHENIRWAEEEEDNALYNVALKRVRYHSLTTSLNAGISCKQWETVKIKQIKAGTLDKLVEYLTPPNVEDLETDPGFFLAFLCTYKSFATTLEVVELLLRRFEEHCQNNLRCNNNKAEQEEVVALKGVMKRICGVMTVWFDKYPNDFDEPPMYPTLSKINQFTERLRNYAGMQELNGLSKSMMEKFCVSPFDYDAPYKFKFCSCPSIVGCTCEASICSATFDYQQSLDISKFSAELIAEQLTLADAELFLKVSPRESLGYFWSKRDQSKGSMSKSIKLTVEQFNAVSFKVISTILSARNKHTNRYSVSSRTKVIEKWIQVALELRELKNFSSLKAVLSSLQSSAIYRLKRTWDHVGRDAKDLYEELSKIFADDLNNKASRDLLMQEGTAKYSTHTLKKNNWKRDIWIKEGITHGTVPYMGTFLTDLMMIDTAFPDKCRGNLINFEKRRKEFETIIQIKLFQQAAKDYQLAPSRDFFVWFNGVPEYSDKEGYNKSLELEPPDVQANHLPCTPQPKQRGKQLKRCKSESDILFEQKQKQKPLCSCESTLSVAKKLDSLSIGEIKKDKLTVPSAVEGPEQMNLGGGGVKLEEQEEEEEDMSFLVARVYFEDSGIAQYKSLKMYANMKSCDVISLTLRKFSCTDDPSQFSLYQIVDRKKMLHVPMNANLFYCIRKSVKDLSFKVCKKRLSKKWKPTGNTTKLASFHRKMRKASFQGEYGGGVIF